MQLYIVDLDKTLLKTNVSFKYFVYLFLKKKVYSFKFFLKALKYFIKYLFFNLSPKDLHRHVFKYFLKGKSSLEIFSYIDEFLDEYLLKILNKKVYKFIQNIDNPNSIYLLSNSPEILVKRISERLNIKNYKGSTYTLSNDNIFEEISEIMDGEKKVEFCKALDIPKKQYIIFTDSIWDMPLINISRKSYLVNPCRKLKKLFYLKKKKGTYNNEYQKTIGLNNSWELL